MLRKRPDEPHLVHRRHDERARERTRAQRGEPRGEAARVLPVAEGVGREGAAAEEEVLEEDDGAEGACPVGDEPEEVRERVVELVCADDRDRDQAAGVSACVLEKGEGERGEWTHMAVARRENM